MPSDPKTSEWRLLKDQFDALVRDEDEHQRSIEMLLDVAIRLRFGELIVRAVQRGNQNSESTRRAQSLR